MKKIVSLMLVVFSMLSLVNYPVYRASAEDDYPINEFGLLRALSVLDEDDFLEKQALTRAEFCDVICRLFKYEIYSDGEVPFRDMQAGRPHPYIDSISALYKKGVIKGFDNNVFMPNNDITVGEAGIIAVTALGYEKLPELGITTYYSQAKDLGVYDGVSAPQNDTLSINDAIRIFYNILYAPIMNYQIEGEEINYYMDEQDTMMGRVYDMYEISGVVTENEITSFYSESILTDGKIRVGEVEYVDKMQGSEEFLGYNVTACVREIDDEEVLVYMYRNEKNTEITFSDEEIIDVEKTKLTYEKAGGKSDSIKLSSALDVIYNGIGKKDYDINNLKPAYGSMRLVDNNDDGVYDLAFVTEYKLLVVQSISKSEHELNIGEKYANHINVNLTDVNCIINVWRNGSLINISEITSGTVLVAADSGTVGGTRKLELFVAEKTIGVLAGVSENSVIVGKTELKPSAVLDLDGSRELVSKTVSYYKDSRGKAVYITAGTSSSEGYGFLFKAMIDEETAEDSVLVKILDTNNEWNKYTLKEKVRNNGDSIKAIDLYNNFLTAADESGNPNGKTIKQLVKYKLDSNGYISRLDLAIDTTTDESREKWARDNGYFRKSLAKKERTYRNDLPGFLAGCNGHNSWWVDCFLERDIPVLVRPDSDNIAEEEVVFNTISYIVTKDRVTAEMYDLGDDNSPSAIVVYGSAAATVTRDDNFVLVDKIVDTLNEDDEPVKKLYGYYMGNPVEYIAENDNAFMYTYQGVTTELRRGDIVRLAKNFAGLVESVENGKLKFRTDNPEEYYTDYNSQGADESAASAFHAVVVGRVDSIYGNCLTVTVKDGKKIKMRMQDYTRYLLFDESNKNNVITGTNKNVLGVGKLVVCRMYFSMLQDVVVYNLD